MGLVSESSPAACLTLTRVQLWWDSRRSCYACALIPLSVTTPPTRCSFLLTLLNLEVKLHAFVQSHSQSQARLMFVNCSQNQCTFQKIHSLSMGGAHLRLLVHIASPTSPPPYVGTQLTALFYTQPLLKCLVYATAAPTVNCA